MATKTKKFKPSANPEMHRAMMELRRSSAASKHVVRKHKGTRAENKHKAMRDWS